MKAQKDFGDLDLAKINSNIEILNSLFEFREAYGMQEDCILDVLEEYAHKYNVDTEMLARELSDLDGFVELVQVDLTKHKYAVSTVSNDADCWA